MDRDSKTLYCGNLEDLVTEELLYELFLQAGPIEDVRIPKDKNGKPRGFGFITFKHAISVPYAMQLMAGESLYGRALRMQQRGNNSGSPTTHSNNGHPISLTCPPGFNFDNKNNQGSPNYRGGQNGNPLRNVDFQNSRMQFPQMNQSPSPSNNMQSPIWFPNYMITPPPPPPPLPKSMSQAIFLGPGRINPDMDQSISAQIQSLRQMRYEQQQIQQALLRYSRPPLQNWPAARR